VFGEFRRDIATLRTSVDVGPPSLKTLQTESDRGAGRTSGSDIFMTRLIALASLVVSAIAIVVLIIHG
jgi:hypothetical protein